MKRFYFLLLAALFAMTAEASAQFVQSVTEPHTNNINNTSKVADYSGSCYYVSYTPTLISWSIEQNYFEKFMPLNSGIAVGYSSRSSLGTTSQPLYFDLGANVAYFFGSATYAYDYSKAKSSVSMISINVPLSVTLPFQTDNITILPYCGINLRYNFSGSFTIAETLQYDDYKEENSYTADLFNKEEMDSGEFTHFQAGLNFGVNIEFDNYSVGIGRINDFSQFMTYEDEEFVMYGKIGVTTISVGYKF